MSVDASKLREWIDGERPRVIKAIARFKEGAESTSWEYSNGSKSFLAKYERQLALMDFALMGMKAERMRCALEDALPYVREASEQVGYGFFQGGDPRDFHPDHEASTDEEIAAHKAACEVYETHREALKNPSEWLKSEDGKSLAHILRAPFGMGTYVIRDRDGADLVERIATLTREEPSDVE